MALVVLLLELFFALNLNVLFWSYLSTQSCQLKPGAECGILSGIQPPVETDQRRGYCHSRNHAGPVLGKCHLCHGLQHPVPLQPGGEGCA